MVRVRDGAPWPLPRYCEEYANLLTLWGKQYSRAELLKFTTPSMDVTSLSHSGLVVEVGVRWFLASQTLQSTRRLVVSHPQNAW